MLGGCSLRCRRSENRLSMLFLFDVSESRRGESRLSESATAHSISRSSFVSRLLSSTPVGITLISQDHGHYPNGNSTS